MGKCGLRMIIEFHKRVIDSRYDICSIFQFPSDSRKKAYFVKAKHSPGFSRGTAEVFSVMSEQ
ncbi:CLUMA_CG021203, isoform A [Clunio marinus]|uniref:CLUMA_CG021203, isoform A n=1 Tax=Clunio marinus TaxID=568069 RepID=A0A1J1J8W3_9DIPT|nr:CLUMA_CG021203, isoform A [Clunio marinus]